MSQSTNHMKENKYNEIMKLYHALIKSYVVYFLLSERDEENASSFKLKVHKNALIQEEKTLISKQSYRTKCSEFEWIMDEYIFSSAGVVGCSGDKDMS